MTEEDMEFCLEQERTSAAIDGDGFDDEAFRKGWREAKEKGIELFRRDENEERIKPIAPKDVALWNPRLNEIRGEHDFLAADITILSRFGIVYVNDLASIPKVDLKNKYDALLEAGLNERMSFSNFTATIKELTNAFPKAHCFLAQPGSERFVGRPDGGRDGSGMMM